MRVDDLKHIAEMLGLALISNTIFWSLIWFFWEYLWTSGVMSFFVIGWFGLAVIGFTIEAFRELIVGLIKLARHGKRRL